MSIEREEGNTLGQTVVLTEGGSAPVQGSIGGCQPFLLLFNRKSFSAVPVGHGHFLPSHQPFFLPLASGYPQDEWRVSFFVNAGGHGTEKSQ